MVSAERSAKLLLAYLVTGLAVSLAIGIVATALLVPGAHEQGAGTARPALDLFLGTLALGYAGGVLSGVIQERRTESGPRSWLRQRVADLSPAGSALLGVLTHLPGLFYLAALNAIAGSARSEWHAAVQVVVYNVIWFVMPAVALVFATRRPEELHTLLERVSAVAQRREREIVVAVSAGLGAYLMGKGVLALL